jgi:hypothetical protein
MSLGKEKHRVPRQGLPQERLSLLKQNITQFEPRAVEDQLPLVRTKLGYALTHRRPPAKVHHRKPSRTPSFLRKMK